MKRDYLFVYGLLKKGTSHQMARLLANQASHIGRATFQGKLFLVDYYPGAIPSEKSQDVVHGDLYLLDDSSLLNKLDEFEGVGPSFSQPNEYKRSIHTVKVEQKDNELAWIYLYNWPVAKYPQIKSGDFISILR